MLERDIWKTARDMISVYGEEAAVYAALRAGATFEEGDEEGYAVWKRIVRAIGELMST
jgi:hypothetical protein